MGAIQKPSEMGRSLGLERIAHGPLAGGALPRHFRFVRQETEDFCAPLEVEDYGLQSMPETSPVKWHLAHTTWFFETFLLERHLSGYRPFNPHFKILFNSYYNGVGPRWTRSQRSLLSRPTVAEIYRYRAHVNEHMERLFQSAQAASLKDIAAVVLLGTHHEQQHQELIVTDLLHAWAANPLHPSYREMRSEEGDPAPQAWLTFPESLAWIGHEGCGFAFDNESPRHRVFLTGFQLANRLATNVEYLAFLNDGGYERPQLWLSDGWTARQAGAWTAPLYWEEREGEWSVVTLAGVRPLHPAEPVCHVSYYEADAFARWADARLPTESEWETAAADVPITGHFLDGGRFHPAVAPGAEDRGPVYQMYGDVWQWTSSPYIGYPGFQPAGGTLGEYNGKFMCNQFVLRGASCATPRSHARRTYRNFFPPDARWQFSGIRLAKDLP
jgi:ergothioneine biosynthesis protein EgtB